MWGKVVRSRTLRAFSNIVVSWQMTSPSRQTDYSSEPSLPKGGAGMQAQADRQSWANAHPGKARSVRAGSL